MSGLLIVAVAMVLLPVIYLGLIAAVGYGVFWHATENASILAGHGAGRGRLMVYVAPIIAGGVLILFMIKPLFARFPQDDRRVSLTPKGEPFLYAFVQALCRCLGAPVPKRIDVDMRVNASAGFRRGLLSFLGNDLVLTLGLPLVAGMNARQLTGVMTHEFGHFTQGLAMRLTYLVRRISTWFARVVYDRDSWDEQLLEWAKNDSGYVYVIVQLARLCVWLSRRILWVLMCMGHGVCCFMLRQQEYNADAYEIRVAGSRTFAGTFEKLALLDVAKGKCNADLSIMYEERRLPDSYPLYLCSLLGRMPQGLVATIQKHLKDTRTGFFSTHPAPGARIQRAEQAEAEGIFTAECPASELFTNFEQLSREVTRLHYGWVLDSDLSNVKLVPLAAARGEQEGLESDCAAFERYFQKLWGMSRPLNLRPDEFPLPEETQEAVARLKRARQRIEAALPKARVLYAKYRKACDDHATAVQARIMLKAGVKIDAQSFGLDQATMADAHAREARCAAAVAELKAKFEPFDAEQRKRLLTALGLLKRSDVGARLHHADELSRQVERYVNTLARLDLVLDRLLELHQSLRGLGAVAQAINKSAAEAGSTHILRDLGRQLEASLAELRSQLDDEPYPFEHAQEGISIGAWAIEVPRLDDDLGKLAQAADQTMERLGSLYHRMVARLASIAEQVESQVGLQPLPPPAEPPAD